ncbi:MAG: hypothetical protein A2W23_07640 [Planctomycetes bacterium RBG_16_43_13]|nr:MAG: hypothetical protein A2W23_07640 [Planctomycetes bacterium RBG_16_43_13]
MSKDTTITHNKKLYQTEEDIASKKVVVEEWTDSSMHIVDNNRDVKYKQITERPVRVAEQSRQISKIKRKSRPDMDHLWRRQIRAVMKRKAEPVSIC